MTDMKQQVKEIEKTIDFAKNRYQVNLTTNQGIIRLELFPDVAPNHCKNLISLTKSGYYNGLTFHRVIKGFMIQGGCPKGSGSGGPGYTINAEFNSKPHEPGVVSMARTNDPNSAGSQFFICLERVSYLDGQYTVFGRAEDKESMETVKKIGEVKTGPQDRPMDSVIISLAEVIETTL